jgi:predicted transcriptional regulator
MSEKLSHKELLDMTSKIVSAHVGNNTVGITDIPRLIEDVYQTVANLGEIPVEQQRHAPVISVKKSVTPDYIVCLEDGKKLKMLKRHLKTAYNMTPEEYREKWGLPADYPMVAPNYAKRRSSLAKQIGLGTKARTRFED